MNLWCGPTSTAGWLLAVFLCIAVVTLAVWSVSRLFPRQRTEDARAILDARLAAGDIAPMTYRAMRAELDIDNQTTMNGTR